MNDPRGSIWRKWDLHVHTPCSLVQLYGSDNDDTWEKYISDLEALPPEFEVLGINDYIFVDGYKKVLKYKESGRLNNISLILPVVEFRLNKFCGTEGKLRKINFHVIFSNKLTPEIIEQQFLNALTSKYKLTPGLEGITWSGLITKESLQDLGEKIKGTVPPDKIQDYGTDIDEGFNNLTLDEDDIIDILKKSSYFQENANPLYLTAVGKTEWESLKWADGSIADKKDIINKADLVFISSETVEQFYNAKQKLTQHNVNNLLLDCSDAKQYRSSNEKDKIGKCFTWIKADPTFKGLQQILHEPDDRLYVGDTPPILQRVQKNKTKYIKSIIINKSSESTYEEEKWFRNIQIDLNHELVAIIGNKGNGKSALADIIGLVGNSKSYSHFSFLNEDKFRQPKNNKARHFEGTVVWESNDTDSQILSEDPDYFNYEKVKYIPQKYLEVLCNEEKDEFEKELEEVIFSHVPEEERLGKSSFRDIIQYQSEVIKKRISLTKDNISELNEEIINIEELLSPEYGKTLKEQLNIKENELKVHIESKPNEVKKPDIDKSIEKQAEEISENIANLSKQKEQHESDIAEKKKEKSKLNKKIAALERVDGKVSTFKLTYDGLTEEIKEDLLDLGIDLSEIISLEIDDKILRNAKNKTTTIITEINKDLNPETQGSLLYKYNWISVKIKEFQQKLDEPNRRYQKYLEQLKEWEAKKQEIIGDIEKEGSVEYYKDLLKEIFEKAPEKLKNKRLKRIDLSKQIINNKKNLIGIFKSLYKPVESFFQEYESDEYPVRFDVTLEVSDFIDDFFSYINQKVKGSFAGIDEGSERLRKLIGKTDFDNEDDVIKCLDKIIEWLETDQRDDNKEQRSIKQQILKDHIGFYDFLFSLDYLIPKYTLKLGDTDLSQLSPGEKGALLLIFYLLIDKNDIPLVMDQPEENLDNQSVYELLVKFIKKAKKRRQIIIVTHNPNLAVVCDAEQIIYAKIDKTNKNAVSYKSGSIENPEINKKIVDVLEGTMPAFSNRNAKYSMSKRLER